MVVPVFNNNIPAYHRVNKKTIKTPTSQSEENSVFLTPKKFEEQIEKICKSSKCTRLEAIFIWCDENGYESEDILPLINNTLRQNLEIDGIESGLLKKKISIF